MSSITDSAHGATEIGLSSLGCISIDGKPQCRRFGKACSIPCAATCIATAMTDFPEAKTEILLAGMLIASSRASSISELHFALSHFEGAIEATSC